MGRRERRGETHHPSYKYDKKDTLSSFALFY
jgi:hypothetical protein